MSDDIDLPNPQSVTVGYVGQPGARTFYLQIWDSGDIRTLKLEKQQVAALGGAIRELLEDLAVEGEEVPALPEVIDPGEHEWVVGTMGLSAVDEATGRITLILHELVPEEELESAASARLGLSVGQLAALAARCEVSLVGGRPNCSLCGRPMDPQGHVCPKTNGHAKH